MTFASKIRTAATVCHYGLVNLFTVPQDDSIVGDLFEEFRNLASRSGLASPRRWYWRQAVKTVASLFTLGWLCCPMVDSPPPYWEDFC